MKTIGIDGKTHTFYNFQLFGLRIDIQDGRIFFNDMLHNRRPWTSFLRNRSMNRIEKKFKELDRLRNIEEKRSKDEWRDYINLLKRS